MNTVRQGLVVAIALRTVAFTTTAMAGKGGVKGPNFGTPPGQAGTPPGQAGTPPGQADTSPGQADTSPGQVLESDPSASPRGQQYNPPGQTFRQTCGNPPFLTCVPE
jgi:hypothetical protein